MKICLDVRYKMESGSSSYIKNLVPELLRQGAKHSFSIVKYPSQSFPFEDRMEHVLLSPQSDAHFPWTLFRLPSELRAKGVGVFHAMKMPAPAGDPVRLVLTAHSISGSYKGSFPIPLKTQIYAWLYADRMFRHADRVVAVSDFVREFLIEERGCSADRIDTIYHGIDPRFQKQDRQAIRPALEKLGLKKDYLLCVGNVTPVKNHLTAVRAFARIADRFDVDLVIAGGTENAYAEKVKAKIASLHLRDRVRLAGFQSGADLVALMSGARLLVFPSLTEGCPVTALEAFSCGLPMVASKRGGLWDLGKDCAVFVNDPMDAESFASEIARVLESAQLEENLRERALRKSESFSWARAAQQHLEVYEKAVREE